MRGAGKLPLNVEGERTIDVDVVKQGWGEVGDLPVSVATCLASHAMNIGYRPVAKKGVPALERARLSHVFQNYVRPETLAAANAPLVARQAGLLLAQAWGGGLVAAVDGMRFVVPVPAAMQFAAPVTPGSMPAAPVDRPRLRTGGNFALLCGEGGQHLLLLALGHVEVIQGVGQFRGDFVEHLR